MTSPDPIQRSRQRRAKRRAAREAQFQAGADRALKGTSVNLHAFFTPDVRRLSGTLVERGWARPVLWVTGVAENSWPSRGACCGSWHLDGRVAADDTRDHLRRFPFRRSAHFIEAMQAVALKKRGRCLSNEYLGIQVHLVFECEEGHVWAAVPASINRRSWCPTCFVAHGKARTRARRRPRGVARVKRQPPPVPAPGRGDKHLGGPGRVREGHAVPGAPIDTTPTISSPKRASTLPTR